MTIISKIKDFQRYLKCKIVRNTKLKQELLLRLALKERGFIPEKLKISIDHETGTNYVNGIKLGIKYPDSFYNLAIQLIPEDKFVSLYFNGNMSDSGSRKLMLEPFFDIKNAIVIESEDGRLQGKKDKFNNDYFQGLANAQFGLCPHQADWVGNEDSLWTYRFVECCFVEAIPILFRKAPLSEKFTKNFYLHWDDQILNAAGSVGISYDKFHARANREKAKELFCLTDEELKQIKKTFKRSTR